VRRRRLAASRRRRAPRSRLPAPRPTASGRPRASRRPFWRPGRFTEIACYTILETRITHFPRKFRTVWLRPRSMPLMSAQLPVTWARLEAGDTATRPAWLVASPLLRLRRLLVVDHAPSLLEELLADESRGNTPQQVRGNEEDLAHCRLSATAYPFTL